MKVSTLFANGIYQQNTNSAVLTDKKTNKQVQPPAKIR